MRKTKSKAARTPAATFGEALVGRGAEIKKLGDGLFKATARELVEQSIAQFSALAALKGKTRDGKEPVVIEMGRFGQKLYGELAAALHAAEDVVRELDREHGYVLPAGLESALMDLRVKLDAAGYLAPKPISPPRSWKVAAKAR